MKRLMAFGLLFLVWILLVSPFELVSGQVRVRTQDVVAGLLVALLAVLVMRKVTPGDRRRLINPMRLFWFLIYIVVLAYYVVKANFDVAYRVLHPEMPIRPGIVKVKTRLKTSAGITALSNSITLTPGTLTVSVSEGGTLYVHWINVKSTDVEVATKQIVRRFEWFLKRILE